MLNHWLKLTTFSYAMLISPVIAEQMISEQILGSIQLEGLKAGAHVLPSKGDNYAARERVGSMERYVTLQGPGPSFDRIFPGAVWIQGRLVYFAAKGGKNYLVDGPKSILINGSPISPLISQRILPSSDFNHYVAFFSDSKTVGWYKNGNLQPSRFDRLHDVPTNSPTSTPIFIAAKNCLMSVIGNPASAKMNWDLLRWISSTDDGVATFVYGDKAGRTLLHQNGKEIFDEPIEAFVFSRDGKRWLTVVDRTIDGADKVELIDNGKPVAEADVDKSRQQLYLSSDGSTWTWIIYSENALSATLKQSGKPDRKLPFAPIEYEFYLSDDGLREAYPTRTADNPPRIQFVVNGINVASSPALIGKSFRFGPGQSFAYKTGEGDSKWIVSHLGTGTKFDEVSSVLFLPNGRPVYGASNNSEHFIVLGLTVLKMPVDDLFYTSTLRIEDSKVKVLGKRGNDIVALTIAD
ncbi:hypothetical protein [Methylomicrobium lacus]|uniref:hypothetical protein n=1 Tax=Methylomicrobium lacus TaxID=136992 RepID=UPI0035A93E35